MGDYIVLNHPEVVALRKRLQHNTYMRSYRKTPQSHQYMLEYMRKYIQSPRMKEYRKKYRNSPKMVAYHNNYTKTKYRDDLDFRIRSRLRCGLNVRFRKENIKKPYSLGKYGISYEAIIKKLGKSPTNGNYHIDHIRPLCSFDLRNPAEIREAFKPENLRWLSANENMKKIKFDKLQKKR